MRDFLERAASAVLGLTAVVIAIVVVHREFFDSPPARGQPKSEYVKEWRSILPAGRLVGSARAPVTLVEFTDLQCPFCDSSTASFKECDGSFRTTWPTSSCTRPLEVIRTP